MNSSTPRCLNQAFIPKQRRDFTSPPHMENTQSGSNLPPSSANLTRFVALFHTSATATGRRNSELCPQPSQSTQRCSLSDSVSTARISSEGRQFSPRHNLKTVSTVGIRRPRSISETYPRSISAISASFSCVIPASRLNRARICPTMRFKSCGSSNEFKGSAYQEPRRISSHYSTIVLAVGFRSQELPVDDTVLDATAFAGSAQGKFTTKAQNASDFRSIKANHSHTKN